MRLGNNSNQKNNFYSLQLIKNYNVMMQNQVDT